MDGDGFHIDSRKFYSSGVLFAHWVSVISLDTKQRVYLVSIPRDASGLIMIDD